MDETDKTLAIDKKRIKTVFYHLQILAKKQNYVELANCFTTYNSIGTRCDMYKGPCSCGAWHKPGDMEKRFRWAYE